MSEEPAAPATLSDLAERVSGLTPRDASEADSQARILELIASASAPFARSHYVPGHLTASAVVVDATRTKALLIFHEKLQLWLQPGGHFEPGEEDPLVAATREAEEETGLRCEPGLPEPLFDLDVHTIPARPAKGDRPPEPAHDHFDLRFLLVASSEDAIVGDGVTAVRWIDLGGAQDLELDPGLRRALSKVQPAEPGA
jgi:8-oxo-dGTP pyrophosphatase MutT (NUDIX family)